VTSSILILHGIENRRPPQHWQFQLAADLARQGLDVRYPDLPAPDAPVLTDWLSALDSELSAMTASSKVVVCHSLACLLWLHASQRRVRTVVDRVLLVAPPASDKVPASGSSFRLDAFNASAVRASARTEIAIVGSDADPYNPAGAKPSMATRWV
jgi:predicted alpha/beta hydrolase family esterase